MRGIIMDYDRTKLLQIFKNNGIFVNEDDLDEALEMDSITYITLVVDIENTFNIEIPDDQLVYNNNFTFKSIDENILADFSQKIK